MGIINHNAIIATTWKNDEYERLKKWIKKFQPEDRILFLTGGPTCNGYLTVVMIPDGSKEGWPESDAGDVLRDEFVTELEKSKHDDGSSPWDYIEVGFGEYDQKILDGNCKNCLTGNEHAGDTKSKGK